MQTNELDKVIKRTYRYWYEDGIGDLQAGSVLILLGLYFLAIKVWGSPPSPLALYSALGLPIVLLVGMLASRVLARKAKAKLVFPRTGFVAYRKPASHRRLKTVIASIFLSILFGVVISSIPISLSWIPLFEGLIIGAFLLYTAHKVDLGRYQLLAALSCLLGALVTLSQVEESTASALFFGGLGICFAVSGLLTLKAYLRLNRSASPEEE
jgi:hypothetical protein